MISAIGRRVDQVEAGQRRVPENLKQGRHRHLLVHLFKDRLLLLYGNLSQVLGNILLDWIKEDVKNCGAIVNRDLETFRICSVENVAKIFRHHRLHFLRQQHRFDQRVWLFGGHEANHDQDRVVQGQPRDLFCVKGADLLEINGSKLFQSSLFII